MPTYQYNCPRCSEGEDRFVPMLDRNKQYCRRCHTKLDFEITAPRVSVWKPDFYWLGSKEKVWCDSKDTLFKECRKRNKYARCHGQENKQLGQEEVAELQRKT